MLLNGQADVMVPAARDADRDAAGVFLPMLRMQPELLMRKDDPHRPTDLKALIAANNLRGLMVRGQSWGGVLEHSLNEQVATRVQRVGDFVTVLRMLVAGRADFTIVTADIFHSMGHREDLRDVVPLLECLPLQGLPGADVGAYVSMALGTADRALVLKVLGAESVRKLMQEPASVAASGPR